MLNAHSCQSCAVTKYDAQQVRQELDAIKALLPNGNWSEATENGECCFCRKETPNRSEGYALIDMAHPEPKRQTRSVLFDKTDLREGALMPVQIPCCEHCRKRIRMLEFLPTWILLAIALIALIVLSIQPVWQGLAAVAMVLPFAVFIIAMLIGVAVRNVLTVWLRKRFMKETYIEPLQLPFLKAMSEHGWVPLHVKRSGVKVVFLKDKMQQGIYTAIQKM